MRKFSKLLKKGQGVIIIIIMITVITALKTNGFSVFHLPVVAASEKQEIVFIDSGVKDSNVLVATIRPGVEVIRLDSGKDGVTQIEEALDNKYEVDAIHIVSHGEPGKLILGNIVLSNENLDRYSQELGIIGEALADNGDILLYGCNVAAESEGITFVDKLAEYTDVQISASSDLTGNTVKGGDWELEYRNINCDTTTVFDNKVNNIYQGLLGDITLTPDEYTGVSYGQELTSGEAGSADATPGIKIYFTDSVTHASAGEVATFDASCIIGCTGIGIFHSKSGYPGSGYCDERMTEYMIIRKTNDGAFNFKEMQVAFGNNLTLVITGFKGGVSTGSPVNYTMSNALSVGKMVTLDSSILTPSTFQDVDEVRVTAKDYDGDTTKQYDDKLVTGGNLFFTSFTLGDPVDTTPPTISSVARNDNTHITVTLSENCDNIAKINNGGFVVHETGTPETTYEVSAIAQGADASHVVLTVADLGISAKEGVTVTYTAGGNGTIQDTAGNVLATDTEGKTVDGWDTVAPTISSGTLAGSNAYIDVVLSEGVYGAGDGTTALTASKFSLTFAQNGGTATNAIISSVKKNDNAVEGSASALTGGETTVRVFLTITGVADGKETIEIKPANGTSIYDKAGNATAAIQTTSTKTLNDKTPPTISSATKISNTQITLTLSENCTNIAKANNGGFVVHETGTPGTTYTVSAIAQGADASHVVLTVADLGISAKEGITVKYTAGGNGTVQDLAGNVLATDAAGKTVDGWDTVAPTISSGTLAGSNAYIDVVLSEGVYGAGDGATALTASKFSLTFTQNGGTATNAIISSVKKNDNALEGSASALTGGETTVRVFLTITGVADGKETIEIKPANGTSIYDKAGNATTAIQTTGTKTLNDKTPPTISSVTKISNTQITVTLSKNCTNIAKANDGGFVVYETGAPGTIYPVSAIAQGADASHVVLIVADMGISAKEGVTVKYTAGGNGTIQDAAGNALATDTAGKTVDGWDTTASTISSGTLAGSNAYIDVVLSEGVYGADDGITALTASKFSITFTQNGGTATNAIISSVKKNDNVVEGLASALTGGETTVRVFLSITGVADGKETIEIKPANVTSIYDKAGNATAAIQTTGVQTLNEKTLPTISSVTRNSNIQITVTLSENCVNIAKANDGGFVVYETGAPGTIYPVSAIAQGADASHVVLTVADMGISAKEGVTVKYTAGGNGTIQDAAGNALATDATGKTVDGWDTTAPTISSGTLAGSNAYIDVVLSEGVYGADDGITALTASKFSLTFTQNGGTATNAIISSVKKNDNAVEGSASALTGGETTVRVFLTITGVADGKETIEIKPTNGTSIYDKAGNAVTTSQTTGAQVLNEKTPPTISSATKISNTQITVTLSENCINIAKANNGGFVVQETGNPGTTYAVSAIAQGADASHVVLTVADLGISAKEGVTVKYTAGGNGTIQDTAGNALATDTAGKTVDGWDTTAPTISSGTLAGSNAYIDVVLSEGVYGAGDGTTALTVSKFSITFAQNGGTATSAVISSVKKNDNAVEGLASALTGGETTVRVFLTITGVADGKETIEIKPANGTSIYDKAGNATAAIQTTGVQALNEKTLPTISSVTKISNTQITVTLSENCTNIAKANDGGFVVYETGAPGTIYPVSAIAQGADASHVVLTVADMGISAKEGVNVSYTAGGNGTIQDIVGNALATDAAGSTIAGWDTTAPTISSGILAGSNAYIDVVFSEGVYGAGDGTTALTASKFSLTFTQNGGTATNATISSVKKNDNAVEGLASALTGGETTVRVFLTITGVADGKETIEIKPVDGTSSYDKAGNAIATIQTTNNVTLHAIGSSTPTTTPIIVSTPEPKPVTQEITVDVTSGNEKDAVVEIRVERTTESDGTKKDAVTFDKEKAKEAIEKLKSDGKNNARIQIPDKNNEIAETKVMIPTESLETLAQGNINLEIQTEHARVSIPMESVQSANQAIMSDLYFRLVPLKKEEEAEEAKERAKEAAKKAANFQVVSGDSTVRSVGNPVTIETNMPSANVDIILPIESEVIPKDEKKREEYFKKLAVFIEHSDGTKELLRGEVVEYTPGVWGIKFTVNKFSIFTIIKADSLAKSNESKLVAVTLPGAKIGKDKITAEVAHGTKTINVKITASKKATWKLYSDAKCTKEIKNKVLSLKEGTNTAYIKITSENGINTKRYTLIVQRNKKPETIKTKKVVLLVTSKGNADAYAGEVLAKQLKGEILRVGTSKKEIQKTITYITKELTSSDTIYILGLERAVKKDVETILKSKGYQNIIRIGGANQYETAQKIVKELKPKQGTAVVLMNVDKLPKNTDNISSISSEKGYPILYVRAGSISKYTINALKDIKPSTIYIVGDTAQFSEKVLKQLRSIIHDNGTGKLIQMK